MKTQDLTTIIEKVSFMGDILLHWKEDNQFSAFLDSNLGVLGHFLWDIRDELKTINRKPDLDKIEIPKSTFDNDRLWEYVAQLNIDGHDPADVLEAWLKEHNPDYFDDEALEIAKFYKTFFEALQTMTDEQKKELETYLSKIVSKKAA